MTEPQYTAEEITVLEGLEAVRKRPGMYIGSTGPRGLHHLVYEVVDNSVDEALAGFCKEVDITIHPDNSVTVSDDGRGIPVDIMPKFKKPALEIVMTTLHAGGKFGGGGYRVTGGLHGVGISVVNALSEWLVVTVRRDGRLHEQRYARGKPVTALLVSETKEKGTGTTVTFRPDPLVFEDIDFDRDTLIERLREMAFLNKGLKMHFVDDREAGGKTVDLHYERGIVEFVKFLAADREPTHLEPIYFAESGEGAAVEVAMQYCRKDYTERIHTFANTINTHEGGSHLVGFRDELTRTLNKYARRMGLLKEKDDNFAGEDVREGLTAVVSVMLEEPQFEGQTKTKLGNPEMRALVAGTVQRRLADYLEEHPSEAKKIVQQAGDARDARLAARKARETERKKNLLEASSLPGKLADCSLSDPESCEIFIVEGDSAGGSAKQARDRSFQAILPLRGKILNVEKSRLAKVLSSEEIRALITALGTSIGEDFDASKARYGRVIIMTDADVDGAHIRALILTFFYRHMKDLIEGGRIFIAQPPLYRVAKGKQHGYCFTEDELAAWSHRLVIDKLVLSTGGKALGKKELLPLLDRLSRYRVRFARVERHDIPALALNALLEAAAVAKLRPGAVDGLGDGITARVPGSKVDVVERQAGYILEIELDIGGERRRVRVDSTMLEGAEFQQLLELHRSLSADFPGPFAVEDKGRDLTIETLYELAAKMSASSREGLTVQRYKGLGEMNPEQLWETTMDPEKRVLLQVTMEEATTADRIFETLMGDKVEPRRAFIEKHARDVEFLDV